MNSGLSISLLGPFKATLHETPLHFRTRSVQALLVYLVCEGERPLQREALMELLWPGMPLASAQANLRQTLYRLRQAIPEVKGKNDAGPVPFAISNRQTVQINPEAHYYADVQAFERLLGKEPARALELYRADFLSDFFLPDSESFEAWASARRAAYRRQFLAALETQTAESLRQGNYERAEQLARRGIDIENLHENSHRQLIEALARGGQRQEALAHYEVLVQLLMDELAIEPDSQTNVLINAIRSGNLAAAGLSAVEVDQTGEEAQGRRHNLPQPLTSFIGRANEIGAVGELISRQRLVMLTGAGGIGKTNLCLQVGRRVVDQFADGVWLVELAPVADPDLVPQAAAGALGVREEPEQPILETLLAYLGELESLLILDNCEHLIGATAHFVQRVLQACPGVKILASSREALGVPGEIPFRVPPLSIPEAHHLPPLAEWERYDALRLFVDRATAVLPDFQVTEENFAPLVKICQRLDGIPLAVELAAARVNILTIAQIAGRLDDRFRLLTGGSRTALPRQQTLRALIDWSWDLLSKKEQILLIRLSVFAGEMDLEAVEAVCAGDGLDAYDLIEVLGELVNKSLVIAQRRQGQPTRYRLLETIRQYAQERLMAAGQGEVFRRRHLVHFLQLAEKAELELVGPEQALWSRKWDRELDNVRAALGWALETDKEAGLRLMNALWRFWRFDYVREGEKWMAHLLAGEEAAAPEIKAKALWVRGIFTFYMANMERSRALAEESLAIYRELGDEAGIAYRTTLPGYFLDWVEQRDLLLESANLLRRSGCKLELGEVLINVAFSEAELNHFDQAMVYQQESEALFREIGHLAGIVEVLCNTAQFAMWNQDLATAQAKLDEARDLQESLGPRNSAYGLQLRGDLHFWQGDFKRAGEYLEQSAALCKESGDYYLRIWVLARLGHVALREGALDRARQILLECLQLFKDAEEEVGVVFVLERLASLAVIQEDPQRAVRLVGWADAQRKALRDARPPIEQADLDRDMDVVLEVIGDEAYTAAYAEGREMKMEEAIALALRPAPGD